jgi:DNA-binding beta-propeller fold protein YncE
MAFSPDGSRLYVPGDTLVHVIDTTTATSAAGTFATSGGTGDVIVSADGAILYTDAANELTRFDVATRNPTGHCTLGASGGPLARSPDGTKLYSGLYPNGPIKQVDVATFTATGTTYATVQYDDFLAVSPDGAYLWVGNHNNGDLRLINVATGAVPKSFPLPDAVTVFSPDGTRAYVRSTPGNGAASLVEISVAAQTVTLSTPLGVNGQGFSLAISPDGQRLLIANYYDKSVMVMNAATKAILHTFPIDAPIGVIIDGNGVGYVSTTGGTVVLLPLP